MKKEELVNIISSRLASQGRETAVAFDVFLQKVAESLEVNESVKIPEVGIFQLKRKPSGHGERGTQEKSSFYLLFVPLKYNRRDKNEVLAFPVNPRNVKKPELEDDVFSLSVDQPVIPVTEQARKDFLVHSSYLMMQKNYEDRAERILSNSVTLSDFEIEYNLSSVTEENTPGLTPEAEEGFLHEEGEHVPWDFGEEESLKDENAVNAAEEDIPEENITEEDQTEENGAGEDSASESTEDDFDAIVAEITGEFSDETPAFDAASADLKEDLLAGADGNPDDEVQPELNSETEDILNEILPDDKLKVPDDLFRDLLGEDEIPGDEIPEKLPELQPNSELGEDWFSLDQIDDDEEEEIGEEPAQIDDQAENIDEKLELLTEMDAGIEIDPFEDFLEEPENPVEEEPSASEEVSDEEVSEEEILGETLLEDTPEEEKPQEEEELVLPEESGHTGISAAGEKMLEDEDEEEEHTSKYPAAFWAILGAVVLITLGGVYYFFFMGKNNPLLPDFLKKGNVKTEAASVVKPQVIERDYSIPVTVYERSKEDASKQNADENLSPAQNNPSVQGNASAQTNSSAQSNAPVQNNAIPENKAQVNKTQVNKTPETKLPETKAPVTKAPETKPAGIKPQQNSTAARDNNAQKNTPVVKNNPPVEKKAETSADQSIQPRSDTKNKLIKEYIFTDGRGRYTIQESSWQSMAEAVKRVKHFRSQGLDAYYTKYAPKGERVWYRVRLGDYNSLEEAEGALKRLR